MIPPDRLLEMARDAGLFDTFEYGQGLTKFAAMIENEVLERAAVDLDEYDERNAAHMVRGLKSSA